MIVNCDNCNKEYKTFLCLIKDNRSKCCSYSCSREFKIKRSVKKLPNGCWKYMGALTQDGYGRHKRTYERAKGVKVPKGICLDHLCRNRYCVNPDHLEPVTPSENKRRGAGVKLDKESVSEIISLKALGIKQRDLAKMYNVHQCNVSRIINQLRWSEK